MVTALENHPLDSRVKLAEDGNVQTLTSRMGTGGNNVPLVMKIRSGSEGGGKGALIQENKSATLSCNNDQTLFEPCGWDGGQISPTLTKQNAGGNQRMPALEIREISSFVSIIFRLYLLKLLILMVLGFFSVHICVRYAVFCYCFR